LRISQSSWRNPRKAERVKFGFEIVATNLTVCHLLKRTKHDGDVEHSERNKRLRDLWKKSGEGWKKTSCDASAEMREELRERLKPKFRRRSGVSAKKRRAFGPSRRKMKLAGGGIVIAHPRRLNERSKTLAWH
jgi:hypothetical protein